MRRAEPVSSEWLDKTPSEEAFYKTTCADVMTRGPIQSCSPDDTVEQALELLGKLRLTGMPVVEKSTGQLVSSW